MTIPHHDAGVGSGRDWVDLLPVAITAAHLGGAVLQRAFRRLAPGEVSEKAAYDFVTAADRGSETVIAEYLHALTPELGLLGEEEGARGSTRSRWVLDPLDGTLNFVRGFPHFAVSLALVVEGQVELGVVFDPMREETYHAARGGGAYCNGKRLLASTRPTLDGAFVTTGFPYRVKPFLDEYLAAFREVFLAVGALRRPGAAALDLAHTAAGVFDGFFELGLSIWDIAAGTLLVREAGGTVSDMAGGGQVFTHGNVVAGGRHVQPSLLALIAPHLQTGRVPLP